MQQEKVVETRICPITHRSFDITEADVALLRRLDPIIAGQKFELPFPTLSPEGRHMRRLSFRNERALYKGISALTGIPFISMYHPGSSYVVYEQNEWWSDAWNPLDYGRDFDFSRPFFEQFGELLHMVPRPNLLTTGMENAEYTNYSSYLKNCYLVFDSTECEDAYYGYNLIGSRDVLDSTMCRASENIYECVDCLNCFSVSYGFQSESCTDCLWISDCDGCTNCIGCIGLRNQKYHVLNRPVSKEIFDDIMSASWKEKQDIFEQYLLLRNAYTFHSKQIGCENCIGNALIRSKNAIHCFDAENIENCRYSGKIRNAKDCMDVESIGGESILLSYEVNGAMDCYRVMFSMGSWGSDIYYCDLSTGKNLFGCIGLRNAQYCIFNKQYTREQYEVLVPKIIEHMMGTNEWGEFFPSSISPFGYNETVAMEYYPLGKDEIIPPTPLSKGGSDEGAGGFVHGSVFNWSDYESPFPRIEKIIPAAKLPDDISKIPDDILNWAIECEVTKTRGGNPLFRIVKQELEFYRKHNLPIPRRHPDQRHLDRLAIRFQKTL